MEPEAPPQCTVELPQHPGLSSIHSRGALSTGLSFPGVLDTWAGMPWRGLGGGSQGEDGESLGPRGGSTTYTILQMGLGFCSESPTREDASPGQEGSGRSPSEGQGARPAVLSGSLGGVMSSKTSSDLRGGNKPAGRGHHVEGASDPTPRGHKRKMLFPRLSRRDFSACCFLTSCSGWGGVGGPRERG